MRAQRAQPQHRFEFLLRTSLSHPLAARDPSSSSGRAPAARLLDRRTFLKRAGGVALAAGTVSLLPLGATPPNTAAGPGAELTPNQRRVHAALIEALAASPALDAVRASRASALTDEMAARYAAESETARANIDAMLAAVEGPGEPGAFTSRPVPARLELLRQRLRTTEAPRPGQPPTRARLVQAAVTLAAAPFYPDWLRFDAAAVAV